MSAMKASLSLKVGDSEFAHTVNLTHHTIIIPENILELSNIIFILYDVCMR